MRTHSRKATARLGAAVLSAIVGFAGAGAAHAASLSDFRTYNYDLLNDNTIDLPGQLYVPGNYNPGQSYPLVVYYHGIGEVGNDSSQITSGNIDNLLAAAKSRGFFLYAPQTPNGWGVDPLNRAMSVIGRATKEYSIDTSRLYVTGLSLGGGATWDNMVQYPKVFAAGVPICGVDVFGTNTATAVTKAAPLVGAPIWAYHARNDATVNVSATRNAVNYIRKADGNKTALTFPLNSSPSNPYYNTGQPYYSDGSTFYSENNLRYSEYASGDHLIWSRAYNESAMYDWMLGETHAPRQLATNEKMLFDFGATQKNSADSQGRFWNSTSQSMSRTWAPPVSFAVTSSGERTGVVVDMINRFNGDDGSGLTSGSIFDSSYAKDSWFVSGTTQGIIGLHGLEPGGQYRIELFASHSDNDGGNGRMTRYTIGGEYHDLQVALNVSNEAVFPSVFADENGMLQLTVQAAPGTTSRYGYLGAMEITAVVPEPIGLLLVPALLAMGLRRRNCVA